MNATSTAKSQSRSLSNHKSKYFIARLVGLLLLALLIWASIMCSSEYSRVKAFRTHPTYRTAVKLLEDDSIQGIIGRFMMFHGGGEGYRRDLLNWVYSDTIPITNTFWNRWILEQHISSMSLESRVVALRHYPLPFTRTLLSFAQEALHQGQYDILPAFERAHSDEARSIYVSWVQQNLFERNDAALFTQVAGQIVQCSYVKPSSLLHRFWTELSREQQDFVLAQLANSVQPDSDLGQDVFNWLKGAFYSGQFDGSRSITRLMARFLGVRGAMGKAALELSEHYYKQLDPKAIVPFLEMINSSQRNLEPHARYQLDIAERWFNEAQYSKPEISVEALHYIAHHDIAQAERVATPILAGPDSELRKGVIVILIRHSSALGRQHLDEAFQGTAPRRTMFGNWRQYEFGSTTTDLYKSLSGHDYEQTGKTWPPSQLGHQADDVEGWKTFIQKYPWFPGTDDAYYRLAYAQYAQGDYESALATIDEFMRTEHPDYDAKPFILFLLRAIAIQHPDFETDKYPFLPHLNVMYMHPLGGVLFDHQPSVSEYESSVKWFLANEQFIGYLNSSKSELLQVEALTQIIRTNLEATRLQAMNAQLGSSSSLVSLLFGRHFGNISEDSNDPNAIAILKIAVPLEKYFAEWRSGRARTQQLEAAIRFALELYVAYKKHNEFRDLFEALFQLDATTLPQDIRYWFQGYQSEWLKSNKPI